MVRISQQGLLALVVAAATRHRGGGVAASSSSGVDFDFRRRLDSEQHTTPLMTVLQDSGGRGLVEGCSCEGDVAQQDSTPPALFVPDDTYAECGEDRSPASTGFATATDNCSPPVFTFTDGDLNGSPPQLERTWVATDSCENAAEGVQIIYVVDGTAPVFGCEPDDVTVECAPDSQEMLASDSCEGEVNIDYDEAPTLNAANELVALIRTWTAADSNGNSAEARQIVTVDSNTDNACDAGPAAGGLDQDTFLDRNRGVTPSLDITGGTNSTDEITIEFWRAKLSNMYNDGDGGDARIAARFYAVKADDGTCDTDTLLGSWVAGGADVPGEAVATTDANEAWMTGSIRDKTVLDGTSTVLAQDATCAARVPMQVSIDIFKSLIEENNPLWHPETVGSTTVGDFKLCVNIQVERHLDTTGDTNLNEWVPLLWRDFLVFMGVNLENNVFSIGDEDGIEVTIDAVENATSTYEKPELAFYQCIGRDNFGESPTAIDDAVAQNGLVQMCVMPNSDDVYICEFEMEVAANDIEETMQKVTKKTLVADDATPAGTPDQSSLVSLYDRKYVDCTFGTEGCDVQKVDVQTLASQAGKFLNITGTVTYCFRAETGRRLENVPFDVNAQLRSLQATDGADEGAGAEPFSVSLKIDKIEYDGDEVSDGYVDDEGDVAVMGGHDNLGTYSAAPAAISNGGLLFKMFGTVIFAGGVGIVLF